MVEGIPPCTSLEALAEGTHPALPEGRLCERAAFGHTGSATGMSILEKGTLLRITSSSQSCPGSVVGRVGGKRGAGKSDFFITCIVLAFLQKTI